MSAWLARARLAALSIVISLFSANAASVTPPPQDFTGFWKDDCHDEFGLQIKPAGNGLYSISFCGPGGCFAPGTYRPNSAIVNDPLYEVVGPTKLRIKGADGFSLAIRCTSDPTPANPKINNGPAQANHAPPAEQLFAATDAGRKLISENAVVSIQRFEVRGDNSNDLNTEIQAKIAGETDAAMGEVKYKYMCQRVEGGNKLQSIVSQCIAKPHLPNWYGFESATPSMKQVWTTWANQRRAHAMGHIAICAAAAKQMREALEALPVANECTPLWKKVDAIVQKIIPEMVSRQRQYDVEARAAEGR